MGRGAMMITTRLEIEKEADDWLVHVRAYNRDMVVQSICMICYNEKPVIGGHRATSGCYCMNVGGNSFWVDEIEINGEKIVKEDFRAGG